MLKSAVRGLSWSPRSRREVLAPLRPRDETGACLSVGQLSFRAHAASADPLFARARFVRARAQEYSSAARRAGRDLDVQTSPRTRRTELLLADMSVESCDKEFHMAKPVPARLVRTGRTARVKFQDEVFVHLRSG